MASQQQEVLLKNAEPGRQEPQPPSNRPRSTFADVWRKWWGVELTSLLLGVASIVGLIAILRNRDDKTAPRNGVVAGVNITLNTVVAILATIGKATLLLAVSECISQLKWTWYLNKHRRLEDLDVFDGASRGAWGGLELLWKINIRQVASLGALLVVVGLPVVPLSQQLVQYDVRNQNITGQPDTASLLTAISWDESDVDDGVALAQHLQYGCTQNKQPLETPSPPLLMKAAILRGLYAGTTTIDHIRPTCPGGNCTYPDYRSLAICARSEDVTSDLKHNEAYADGPWYLTNSNYLINDGSFDGSFVFNLSSAAKENPTKYNGYGTPMALDFSRSIAFKDSSAPVADVFMIYSTSRDNSDNSDKIGALEFLLEWCVQSYSSTVTNGTATTERLEAVSLKDGDYPDFMLGPGTLELYQNYFREIFQGEAWRAGNPTRLYVSNDATQVLFQPVNIFGKTENGTSVTANQGGGKDQLEKILDNIAVAMTNVIRTNYNKASTTTKSKPDNIHPLITGTPWVQETYVNVQWGWIAAPIGLLVGSVLFVLGVIISSLSCDRRQRPGVWKSSNLPLLKALDGDLYHEGPSGMTSPRSMKEWAKEVPVRLTRDADGDGWKLMRHWGGGEKSANQDGND